MAAVELAGPVTLPVRSETTGHTLVACGRTAKGARVQWTAIWRTGRGNFIHQPTPFTTDRDDQADAIAWALDNPEAW